MGLLTADQIVKENQNKDPSSITSLELKVRAISDVSFLSSFTNLQRLDLSCNNVSSLEGLGACVSLKWLSVAQNKIASLKGIEGLLNLTVLNAGQNMLKSMDEVTFLTSLRALILNDNNISTVCKLAPLHYLNTLVLSRNPIYSLGCSLENMKSITKLSLSNCRIKDIGSSLLFCVQLKEAKFAHNEITALPNHLAKNVRLQLLDLGKNAISRWSDLEVVSTLKNLRNLNLQGNPIADENKFAKKIRNLVPNVQILNAKPIDKSHKSKETSENGMLSDNKGDHSAKDAVANDAEIGVKKKRSYREGNASDRNLLILNRDDNAASVKEKDQISKKTERTNDQINTKIISSTLMDVASPFDYFDIKAREEEKRQTTKKVKGGCRSKEFDDGETSFMDLMHVEDSNQKQGKSDAGLGEKPLDGLVINPVKKKKKARGSVSGNSALKLLPPASEVGLGGPSAWED